MSRTARSLKQYIDQPRYDAMATMHMRFLASMLIAGRY
jgi:hypothetical protein